ncbi:MAG: 16S rRNA (adenine(1518)-N(6)/adenine(1519)-N(6))-dimethyltransferase RsmA [Desulfobacteraceae bacterium]|nr:16S rRNA (adenine(1518)-N(6)/adenine(1519)-N(6))-dimethyltransferase RsmA [Desulfobacteraceae bacterium]
MTAPHCLLTHLGLSPKKHMGQNFLTDPSTAKMIVRRARLEDAVVVEIGAGVGALTVFAGYSARRVYAVEKDRDLTGILQGVLSEQGAENVEVINENIFDLDLSAIAEKENTRLVVLGNLPYNISSQVIVSLLFQRQIIERAVLMLQSEMARRLYSNPGSKEYGRLSVLTGYCASVSRVAKVGAHQFYPRPKVDSEVVEIYFEPPAQKAEDEEFLSAVVKAAFGQRRKTLRNSLTGGDLGINKRQIEAALARAGISGSRRAETLSVSEFVNLSNILAAVR